MSKTRLGKEYYFRLLPCLYDSISADYEDPDGRFPALVDFVKEEMNEALADSRRKWE